jgi:hypothetical protein
MRFAPYHLFPWLCLLLQFLWTLAGMAQTQERGVTVEAGTPGSKNEGNWAVVIGVNKFKDETVSPLSYAVADAKSIYTELTKPGGLVPPQQAYLHITDGKLSPSRNDILKSITYIAKNTPTNGMIVVFVSSHGFIGENGASYVMPTDGDLGLLEDSAIRVTRINELLNPPYCSAERRMLIVDACRNNPTKTTGIKGVMVTEDASSRFVEELRKAKGLVTLVSCGQGEYSYEDQSFGHGIYTHYLLEGLNGKAPRNNDGFVTVTTLADYVSGQVMDWCKANQKMPIQRPWLQAEISSSIPLANPPILDPQNKPPTPPPVVQEEIRPETPQAFAEESFSLPGGVPLQMVFLPGEGAGNGFWIGKYEVTQEQWRSVVENVARVGREIESDPSKTKGGDLPVENVSLEDCREFCQRLSKESGKKFRLPSENEWEYACQGGSGQASPWGNDPKSAPQYANTADLDFSRENNSVESAPDWSDGFARTAPAGSFKANAYQLYDMLGNVGEWCEGRERVYKGGTWGQAASELKATTRQQLSPKTPPSGFVGLRLVREP